MSTVLLIGVVEYCVDGRDGIEDDLEFSQLIEAHARAAESPDIICGCLGGSRPNLIPFRFGVGYRCRRVRVTDLHGPECPYRHPEPKPDRLVDVLQAQTRVQNDIRVSGAISLGYSSGLVGTNEASTRARHLLEHVYAAAWVHANAKPFSRFRNPNEYHMEQALSQYFADLSTSGGGEVLESLEAQSVDLLLGRASLVFRPDALNDRDYPVLFTRFASLGAGWSLRNECRLVPQKLLLRTAAIRCVANQPVQLREGECFVLGVESREGEIQQFQTVGAATIDGVMFPVDSDAERQLAIRFAAEGRAFFRSSSLTMIRKFLAYLEVDPGRIERLDHRPDFICPTNPAHLVFVEVTSYQTGPLAVEHRHEVLQRIEHYISVFGSIVVIEVWRRSGVCCEHVATVRSIADLESLRTASDVML